MATPSPHKKSSNTIFPEDVENDDKFETTTTKNVRWIDDENSLAFLQEVENMPTSRMTVVQFVAAFRKVRNHPVALACPVAPACLADKVSKVKGDVGDEFATIFGAHADVVEGKGSRDMKLSTLFSNLADMEEGTLASDMDNTLKYLPKGVSVCDWCTAVGEAFGNNACYCRGVGSGVTKCADFVRLAAPLGSPKTCKVSDLFDLFRQLWSNPFIALHGWTDEMKTLHDNYNHFIQDRPWLYRALDPGFVMTEGLTPADLAATMNNVPLAAAGIADPDTLGISAAPVALPYLSTIYQVVDLGEARLTAKFVQGAHPPVHGFGVGTALGNTFMF